MPNFLLLYSGGDSAMAATPAEQQAVIGQWTAWYTSLGSAVVDGGNPFSPMAKSVASNGAVSDGPVGVLATGYTVVAAGSLDAAVQMAKGCPVLKNGGQITVYETFNVM
jgi:hypothetical protein